MCHAFMNVRRFLAAAILVIPACATSAPIAGTPAALRPSEILDSLESGRKRWADARVAEYQLQSHVDCFCVYLPDAFASDLPLLTIRNGSIISRAKGKPGTPPSRAATIEDLFAEIEEDARSSGRIIERLELHPVYGFPIWYKASYPQIPDAWVQVRVDSFAVIRTR